ncbi:MAG: hypothetical protein V3T70_07635 [Phycisphaerae bacterium]
MTRFAWMAVIAAAALSTGLGAKFWSHSRFERERARCVKNLERIGRAMSAYWSVSDHHWPAMAKLPSLADPDGGRAGMADVLGALVDAGGESPFACPSDRRMLLDGDPLLRGFGRRTTYFQTEGTSYEWLLGGMYAGRPVGKETTRGRRALGGGPADQPMMWEFEPFHGGAGTPGAVNILYVDLVVRSDDYQQKIRRRR